MVTTTAPTQGNIGSIARAALRPTVLLNVIAPLVAYQVMHLAGVSDLLALSLAAAFPATATLVAVARTRRLDVLGALSLTFIVLGVGTAALFQDPQLVLVANAAPGGLIGLIFLGSVGTQKPMLYLLGRQFAGGTRLAALWAMSAAFRHRLRIMTAVWGAALVAGSIAHVAVALLLPTPTAVSLGPVIMVLALGPAALHTMRERARAAAASWSGKPPSGREMS